MSAPTSTGLRWRTPWFQLLLTGLGACLLLFIIAPLVGLLLSTSGSSLAEALVDPVVTGSIKLTLAAGLMATLACTIFGIPLAYLLARKSFPGRALLLAIIDLPIIIPHSAAGIALLTVLGRNGWPGSALEAAGMGVVGRLSGVAVAMAFVSLPFMVNAAREGFGAVPERLEKVARTLGATPARVFFTISLPMAWRAIVSGMVLMWGRGISEFGAVIIIAYHPMTTPVMVYQRFNDFGLEAAESVAVILLVVCVVIFGVLRLAARPWLTRGARDA